LPALHGGLIGGFLENAALLHLIWHRESLEAPKIVDFSLDYLRSGRSQTLFARCEITKQGKRVAHVLIEAWQEDRRKPVAVARAHFLLTQ
jgi:acyl-coenzyme A thioesterase PaaI-like protein